MSISPDGALVAIMDTPHVLRIVSTDGTNLCSIVAYVDVPSHSDITWDEFLGAEPARPPRDDLDELNASERRRQSHICQFDTVRGPSTIERD